MTRDLYPLFLRLDARRVLVVGGGSVASRKVRELLEAGARVTVVTMHASAEIERLAQQGTVELIVRGFEPHDVEGAWLVVAATNDTAANRGVSEAAESRRVFVNAVDDPANGSAIFAALVRRPPFTIAISSSGEVPALSRLVRQVIEAVLPEERWVEKARALRRRWKADETPMTSRFGELVAEIAREVDRRESTP